MKKIFSIMMIAVFLLSSCEHEDMSYITREFQVGNILCDDGSIIHPSVYKSGEYNPVGVVFWVNEDGKQTSDKAYAVGLENMLSGYLMADSLLVDIPNVSSDKTALDGFPNTVAYQSFMIENKGETPIIKEVIDYTPSGRKGWYIGSIAQEILLYKSKKNVDATLEILNAEPITGEYWSSTEEEGEQAAALYSLSMNYNSGSITPVMKTKFLPIRPFITINK